ncbi:MAG TPA: PIN domain-containing protein [Terracidiphilus sp.]|nr:PIN domain-containing protein [Terracidiphilus sp.]
MNKIVLDASAVLARIHNEPGGERVDALLDAIEMGADVQVSISSVNWCEILTCLQRESVTNPGEKLASLLAGVELVPFGRAEAELAATIVRVNPALSLGDRACLSLASLLDATPWTTDKIWAQMPVGAKLEMLR